MTNSKSEYVCLKSESTASGRNCSPLKTGKPILTRGMPLCIWDFLLSFQGCGWLSQATATRVTEGSSQVWLILYANNFLSSVYRTLARSEIGRASCRERVEI